MPYTYLSDEDWYAKMTGLSADGDGPLFPLPSEKIQTSTVGRSGTPILNDAFMFWQFCQQMLIQYGNGLSPDTKVMDFGCAWGRIIRFWMRDILPENLHGFDVEDRFLALAREHVPGPHYALSKPTPPLPIETGSLDLIYAFSVFSHLPQTIADAWIEEFARVLKPGGIACLTTRPRAHIEVAGTEPNKTAHSDIYARLITEKQHALDRYDAGKFIFYSLHGGGGLSAETYGEAIIPPDYAKKHWSALNCIGFFENYSATYLQPCFVLQKHR